MRSTISICLILTVLLSAISLNAQQDEERFLQGMMKEEGEGNLEEAIEIYQTLVNDNSADRAYRAKALFQIGICYEKLGKNKASMAYQKLISEYGDQRDLIAVAKRKLKLLKKTPLVPQSEGVVIQELKKGLRNELFSVSPDGRFMVWMGYRDGVPELERHDMLSGKDEFITSGNEGIYGSPDNYYPWGAVWSKDSKKVAYLLVYRFQDRKDLRISDANGSNTRILITGRKNNMTNYEKKDPSPMDHSLGRVGDVYDFSPDNQKLLFTRNRIVDGEWRRELAELSLSDNSVKILKTNAVGSGINPENGFKYSPDGRYLVYSDWSDDSGSEDIFIYDIQNRSVTPITAESFKENSPFWSPSGNRILYASNNYVSTDLMMLRIEKGRPAGKAKLVMKNLGYDVEMTGIDNQGAIYYNTTTTKNKIYTVDLDKNFDFDVGSLKEISIPSLRYGGDFARFSKDGRYISYQTPYSETFRGYSKAYPEYEHDPALGNKYAIFIYDSRNGRSKFLDIDLFQNHSPRANMWMVPEWSYHGSKLIVNGRSRKDYEGGFFEIDVETEEVSPILTMPGSKHNDMKLVGQYMRYSKKPDIIYYSSLGWKQVRQYNRKTKEDKVIATIEDGFWFEGFSDEAETIVRAVNRFGVFEYDINTHEIKTLREGGYPHPQFPIPSVNGKNSFLDLRRDEEGQRRGLQVLGEDGNLFKELDLKSLFENDDIDVLEKHPKKDQFLIRVSSNKGKSIYRINKVFDLN